MQVEDNEVIQLNFSGISIALAIAALSPVCDAHSHYS